MIALDLNGYTDVPAGKVAAVVTFLERRSPPAAPPVRPEGVDLTLEKRPDPEGYRALYREIGADWLWFSRLLLPESALATTLSESHRELRIARNGGAAIGLVELDRSDPASVEIAFFGLVPSAVGRGLGRWLMEEGLAAAWSDPPVDRVWLHTCTLDHPNALGFYQKCGFVPYHRAIEIADDPRLGGVLPETAGNHHPIIR